MATQFYVTGPAIIYVGTGGSQAYECLGFSESGVNLSGTYLDEDVPADFAGLMPADVARLGLQMQIQMVLSKYDEAVYQKVIKAVPNSVVDGSGVGSFGTNELGTLLVAEGAYFPLAINAPYAVKTVFNAQIPWWVFGSVHVSDSFDVNVSIRSKRPSLVFSSIPTYGNTPYNKPVIYSNVAPSPLPTPT